MGQLMRPICDTVTIAHASPVARPNQTEQLFGIAVRLPSNWGQAAIALSVLLGFMMVTMALIWSYGSDQDAVIAAKNEVIAAKDAHIASLEEANENLTKVATKTVTGLSSEDFYAMAGIFLMAICLGCLCSIKTFPVAVFSGAVGVILLVTGGG